MVSKILLPEKPNEYPKWKRVLLCKDNSYSDKISVTNVNGYSMHLTENGSKINISNYNEISLVLFHKQNNNKDLCRQIIYPLLSDILKETQLSIDYPSFGSFRIKGNRFDTFDSIYIRPNSSFALFVR